MLYFTFISRTLIIVTIYSHLLHRITILVINRSDNRLTAYMYFLLFIFRFMFLSVYNVSIFGILFILPTLAYSPCICPLCSQFCYYSYYYTPYSHTFYWPWNLTSNSTYRTIDTTWSATFSMKVYRARGSGHTAREREDSRCFNRRTTPPFRTTWTRQINVTGRPDSVPKSSNSSISHSRTITFVAC